MVYTIVAKERKEAVEDIRSHGGIPGVVYGPEMTAISISMPYHDFEVLYNTAGESNLIDLSIAGNASPVKVLVQDVQYNPITGRVIHVDFRQINMKREMKAPVQIIFVGEAPAVKGLGGTLVKALSVLNVKCLPQDLVGSIEVDISRLKTFADAIRIADITLPSGITISDSPDTTIAKVLAPLTEDQIKAMEEAAVPANLADIKTEAEEKRAKEAAETAAAAEAEGKEEKKDKTDKKE